MKKIVLVILATVALAGCSPRQERVAVGAGLGGAAGAVIGGLATGSAGGAVVGGVIGAAGGAVVADATRPRRSRCYIDSRGYRVCRR
ncbi:MAG: hypothetical protein JWN93_653 [Hyphomicrobiales bacterium]|nr:hypothetical protein [Hyphomicrobiales bacterium]